MGTALGNAMKQIGASLSGEGQTPNEPKTGLCPDCGKIVSKLAKTCPHCGRPLDAGDVIENPENKPVFMRTAEDHEAIRNARGTNGGKQTSTAGIVVAVVIGLLIAVWILTQTMHVEVTGTIVPMK